MCPYAQRGPPLGGPLPSLLFRTATFIRLCGCGALHPGYSPERRRPRKWTPPQRCDIYSTLDHLLGSSGRLIAPSGCTRDTRQARNMPGVRTPRHLTGRSRHAREGGVRAEDLFGETRPSGEAAMHNTGIMLPGETGIHLGHLGVMPAEHTASRPGERRESRAYDKYHHDCEHQQRAFHSESSVTSESSPG